MDACEGFGKVIFRGAFLVWTSDRRRCVVKSESTCNLRRDVGIFAVPDNSSLAFLASFRIKFR